MVNTIVMRKSVTILIALVNIMTIIIRLAGWQADKNKKDNLMFYHQKLHRYCVVNTAIVQNINDVTGT